MSIQRYRTNHINGDYYPDNGGELVRYADHVAAMEAAEQSSYFRGAKHGISDERARIKAAVQALGPLLDMDKYNGGYDCCGCSTTYDLHEHVLAIIDVIYCDPAQRRALTTDQPRPVPISNDGG